MSEPVAPGAGRFVAVDWGTTRMRASLVDRDGRMIDRTTSDAGVQSVPAGGFPDALRSACGRWFDADPGLPVIMAGMVGSRNGWCEVPYVRAPCGFDDIARDMARAPGFDGRVAIVPGVDARWDDGAYDVMRGEETQVLGTGVADGLVCLPGTHSKWVEMSAGKIARFVTFVTGELYAALTHSFLGRLAEDPDDPTAAEGIAIATARSAGGLTRALFQARTRVLGGDMPGAAVRPFLSRLLVEAELDGAVALFGGPAIVHLVAGEPQLGTYGAALAARGIGVRAIDPGEATMAGLARLMGPPPA